MKSKTEYQYRSWKFKKIHERRENGSKEELFIYTLKNHLGMMIVANRVNSSIFRVTVENVKNQMRSSQLLRCDNINQILESAAKKMLCSSQLMDGVFDPLFINGPFAEKYISGEVCPYCEVPCDYVDDSEIYNGVSYGGKAFVCPSCGAYVGCHKDSRRHNSGESFGSVANKLLRSQRKDLHGVFDEMWKIHNGDRRKWRNYYYSLLADEMKIPAEYCHIGMFNEELVLKAKEIILKWIK
jgi:hypothetical protein